MNIGVGLLGGDLDGSSTGADFLQSFSRGASAAMVGKTFGKGVMYGGGLKDAYIPKFFKKEFISYPLAALEKGTGNLANYYGKFGAGASKFKDDGFYGRAFFAGMASGLLSQGLGDLTMSFKQKTFETVFMQGIANGMTSLSSDLLKDHIFKSGASQQYKDYLKSLNDLQRENKTLSMVLRAGLSFASFTSSGAMWNWNNY